MSQQIISKKTYLFVFIALLGLTFLTTEIASIDLGRLNVVVAMTIAVCKALLVMLFFMHLRYSNRLVWLFAGAGIFWLLLLIGLTLNDYLSRNWLSFAAR